MNLTKYFFDNYDEEKFPYYKKVLKNYDLENWKNYPCEYIDDDEIISKWKAYTHPGIDDEEIVFEFIILSFYLLNTGYVIEEHPNLLYKIDTPESISDGVFKEATRFKIGTKSNGAVAWADRRLYSNNLTFKKKNSGLPYSTNINDIFKIVSTGSKSFEEMTLDEKLEQIRNVFSYIGQTENGKYINIDIEFISCGYMNKEQLLKYQKELHCFRHGEKNMIEKRTKYTDEQKMFLIDYGLMIINATERFINKK